MNTNEVIIPCRLSYANIWEPKQVNGTGDPKYSCCLLIKKTDTAALAKLRAAIEAVKKDPKALAKWGGSVPKNFFPAVEKGLREAANKGVLAGYPLVGLKATLYDGSYHPVDSNEMAFKTAAQLAYKEGIANANPTILEPIGELKVTIPDSYLGDVMGDLNKRRGRVMGMNPTDDGNQILEAEVPMAEMTSYAIDLRSITQSRGTFSFHFVRYEEAPPRRPAKGHRRRQSHPGRG